ncbi:hypothetical protein [Minisyncoccus archaeiphilus]|uniref:hypothetical protein n=1 Tax=Minisyncoccus archaeiphilus TaxID=3238481 RepID=UPI00399D473C
MVENSFKENEVINILFISHFHDDHINKIKLLKPKIEFVVLPIVNSFEKFILGLVFGVDSDLYKIASSPENYFSENVKIIRVSNDVAPEGTKVLYGDLDKKRSIQSGTEVVIRDWVFVPYNINTGDELRIELKKNGIDYEHIDGDYFIKNEVKIKKIYNDFNENKFSVINLNSMVLYSGPVGLENYFLSASYQSQFIIKNIDIYEQRPGCLYTGDIDLSESLIADKIFKYYNNYWKYIGTIQVPHHGGIGFDKKILTGQRYFCPISAGRNSKHHPRGDILVDIIKNSGYSILITEDKDSSFIQYYYEKGEKSKKEREIFSILIYFAKKRKKITYGDLGSIVGLAPLMLHGPLGRIGDALAKIDWLERDGPLMIQALVIGEELNIPGKGFDRFVSKEYELLRKKEDFDEMRKRVGVIHEEIFGYQYWDDVCNKVIF